MGGGRIADLLEVGAQVCGPGRRASGTPGSRPRAGRAPRAARRRARPAPWPRASMALHRVARAARAGPRGASRPMSHATSELDARPFAIHSTAYFVASRQPACPRVCDGVGIAARCPNSLLGPAAALRGRRHAPSSGWRPTSPCEVDRVRRGRARPSTPSTAEGHHYGLVRAEGPGARRTRYEYEVLLDGEQAWPLRPTRTSHRASFATLDADTADDPLEIAFGSCRVAVPNEEPVQR